MPSLHPTRTLRRAAIALLTAIGVSLPALAGTMADLAARTSGATAVAPRSAPAVAGSAGGIAEVVEYYNPTLRHFFVTAYPAEIASLDSGAFGSAWQRTNNLFPAWDVSGAPAGSVPVCRFFGTDQYRGDGTRIGPNSHFYTADPAECAFVKTAWPSTAGNGVAYPAWSYEADAFAATLPAGGACAAGTQGLYRAYNNGADGDPNHRYSLNAGVLQGMAGWSFEGLVMCVPAGQAVVLPEALAGCGNCPEATQLGNGGGLVNVIVTIANPGGTPMEIVVPPGSLFSSQSDTLQNGIALERLQATIAPGSTRTFVLALFCINVTLGPSSDGSVYSPAGITTNGPLLELAAMADGKLGGGVDTYGAKASATQQAVWVITDGPGTLSATQKGLLAQIYAAPGDSPALFDLYEQFVDSLP